MLPRSSRLTLVKSPENPGIIRPQLTFDNNFLYLRKSDNSTSRLENTI